MASVIVSPALSRPNMKDNVTVRIKSVARSLTYSPRHDTCMDSVEDNQVIGAVDDMEMEDTPDDNTMADDQNDNLLDDELMELECNSQGLEAAALETKSGGYGPSRSSRDVIMGAPLSS